MTTFAFVSAERGNHAVTTLCRVLGASVSGFYAWLHAIPSVQNRAEAEAELRGHIGRIFAARRRVYGSPRIHAELRREGHRHGRRRVAQLMREMGLSARQGRRPAPCTTDSRHARPVAPNLLARNFVAELPNQVWLADISTLPTDEGWLYLAAIKDMATREIVGWSMAEHLRTELCTAALVMALQRCRPARGLIQHSARGVQYASEACQAAGAARHSAVHEPLRQLPGQFAHGELLCLAEEGGRAPRPLPHPRGSSGGGVRVHRGVLQPAAPALRRGLPHTGRGTRRHAPKHHAHGRVTL